MRFSSLAAVCLLAISQGALAESIRPAVFTAASSCDHEKLEIIGNLNSVEKTASNVVSAPLRRFGESAAKLIDHTEYAKSHPEYPKDKLAEYERDAKRCAAFVRTVKAFGGDMNLALRDATFDTASLALDLGADPSAINRYESSLQKANNTYGMLAVKSILNSAKATGPVDSVLDAVKAVAGRTKNINHVNANGETMLSMAMSYWDHRVTDPVITELVKLGAKTSWMHKGKTINAMDLYKGSSNEVLRLLKPN